MGSENSNHEVSPETSVEMNPERLQLRDALVNTAKVVADALRQAVALGTRLPVLGDLSWRPSDNWREKGQFVPDDSLKKDIRALLGFMGTGVDAIQCLGSASVVDTTSQAIDLILKQPGGALKPRTAYLTEETGETSDGLFATVWHTPVNSTTGREGFGLHKQYLNIPPLRPAIPYRTVVELEVLETDQGSVVRFDVSSSRLVGRRVEPLSGSQVFQLNPDGTITLQVVDTVDGEKKVIADFTTLYE